MDPDALQHLERGASLYEAGAFSEAIAEFERGYDLDPHPDFLYAMAQAHRRSGNCKRAIRLYEDFLATGPPVREAERAQANVARCATETGSSEPAPPTIASARNPAIGKTLGTEVMAPDFSWIDSAGASLARPSRAIGPSAGSYPLSEALRPLTLPKGMVEIGMSMEVEAGASGRLENSFVRTAARIGLRDRLELDAGLDLLLSASTADREVYRNTGQPTAPALDDVRLSVAVQFPLHRDVMDFRIGLDVPMNFGAPGGDPSSQLPASDPPSWLELDIVLGMPVRWAVAERWAIIALDRAFTLHLFTGSSPEIAVPLGLIMTPSETTSVILRGELLFPQFGEYLSASASAALQFSTTRQVDLGMRLTFAPSAFDSPELEEPSFDRLDIQTRRLFQVYVQTRF
jgi:hypothetical protein